ncbi:hypothetical protein, partial [Thiolapillus sp.]
IGILLCRLLGGSRPGVFPMDSRICQTFTVSPAEPGDFPVWLKAGLNILFVYRSDGKLFAPGFYHINPGMLFGAASRLDFE